MTNPKGIYILKTKSETDFEYRVASSTYSIESFRKHWCDYLKTWPPNTKVIREVFENCKVYISRKKAIQKAIDLLKSDNKFNNMEHGICLITLWKNQHFAEIT